MSSITLPRLAVAAVATTLLLVPATATSAPTVDATPRAAATQQAANQKLGRQLVDRFWRLLKEKDQAGLRAFLSPAFQIQRADGSGANRNQYVPSVGKSVVINDYTLSGFKVTRAGDILVARFIVVTTEIINGQSYTKAAMPRIATFAYDDMQWRMTSNANFNAP